MKMRKCTGRWFLHKRFLGGHTIIVEVIKRSFNPADGSVDPEVTTWEKASEKDLVEIELIGIQNYEPCK